MRRCFQICGWMLLLGALPTQALAEVVSLEELERSVLKNQPLLEADRARARAADAEMRKVSSAYYPQVGLKAESNAAPGRNVVTVADIKGVEYKVQGARTITDGSSAYTPQLRHGVDLSAGAQLYDFGRTRAAVAAGRAASDAARASGAVTREALVRKLRDAYLSWLAAHQQYALAEVGREDATKRFERVGALIADGIRSKSDLAPAETETLLADLELTRARGDLAEARFALESVLGAPLSATAEPDTSLLSRELRVEAEPETDATGRSLSLQREAAYAESRAAETLQRPVLAAAVAAGVRVQQSFTFPSYAAGLTLAVPLWDGGLAKATSAASKARGDELDARLRSRLRDQQLQVERARAASEQAQQVLGVANSLLAQCATRLAQAEEGYKLGALSIDQIYQARAMVRRAESEVLFARIARVEAVLRVTPVHADE